MTTCWLASALAFIGVACATSQAAVSKAGSGRLDLASVEPRPATLVLVVNPSARALRLELDHAKQIVANVAAPDLTLLGIYEQPTGVKKAPFDRPFISTNIPSVGTAPLRPKPMICKGTEYQKKKCERDNADAEAGYQRALAKWKKANTAKTERWKRDTLRTFSQLATMGQTEEAPNNDWDLRGAFLQVGQLLAALATPTRCVVLLGGVAVRNPPDHLRADLLAGTSVIIPGWHGTQDVQDRWSRKLSDAGASPVFLPQAITDLALVDRVRTCLKQA